MGRAGRWLRNLWSGSKEHRDNTSSYSSEEARTTAEKKRWSFRKSRDSGDASSAQHASTAAAIEAAWFQSFYAASEKEQSKHAIAVATATAAAADAAVAAAEAAAAVVRLAGGGGAGAGLFSRQMEAAAVKIQTAFRAYLARKARRALKALVKLQALVRGYIVRKQAAATLHSMQALVRAQATVRAQRSQNILLDQDRNLLPPEIYHRRSLETISDARNRHQSSFQTRRLSTSVDGGGARSPRTVEIDAWRGGRRPSSRRTCSSSAFDPAEDDSLLHAFSSPLPCPVPARLSIPSRRNFPENDWCTSAGDDDSCRLPATAHNTPRYTTPSAVTPAKSVCVAEGVFRKYSSVSSSPSYMASTRSSMARLRTSQMAIKRQPLGEINLDARANLAGIGTQKSHSQVREAFCFRKAVIEKLDRRSSEQGKKIKEVHLQRCN